MNIYEGENLEKILSFKGTLSIQNNNELTTLDELQYYRNVTSLNVQNNKNLAGEIDFNKISNNSRITLSSVIVH